MANIFSAILKRFRGPLTKRTQVNVPGLYHRDASEEYLERRQDGPRREIYNDEGEALKEAVKNISAPKVLRFLPSGEPTVQNMGDPVVPTVDRPRFADAAAEGKGLTKRGHLINTLVSLGQGAAIGAGQPDFSSGFRAAQMHPLQMHARRLALRQQEIDAEAGIEDLYTKRANRRLMPGKVASEIARNDAVAQYNRARAGQPGRSPRTVEIDGRVMQFNPETQRFDIEVGPAPKRPIGGEVGAFLQDPEATKEFLELKAKIQKQYKVNDPSATEIMVELFRSDPETFDAVFNRGAEQRQDALDVKLMEMAGGLTGYDPTNPAHQKRLKALRGAVQQSRQNRKSPSGGSDMPPPAALNTLKEGVETTFSNGQKWTLRNGQPVRVRKSNGKR